MTSQPVAGSTSPSYFLLRSGKEAECAPAPILRFRRSPSPAQRREALKAYVREDSETAVVQKSHRTHDTDATTRTDEPNHGKLQEDTVVVQNEEGTPCSSNEEKSDIVRASNESKHDEHELQKESLLYEVVDMGVQTETNVEEEEDVHKHDQKPQQTRGRSPARSKKSSSESNDIGTRLHSQSPARNSRSLVQMQTASFRQLYSPVQRTVGIHETIMSSPNPYADGHPSDALEVDDEEEHKEVVANHSEKGQSSGVVTPTANRKTEENGGPDATTPRSGGVKPLISLLSPDSGRRQKAFSPIITPHRQVHSTRKEGAVFEDLYQTAIDQEKQKLFQAMTNDNKNSFREINKMWVGIGVKEEPRDPTQIPSYQQKIPWNKSTSFYSSTTPRKLNESRSQWHKESTKYMSTSMLRIPVGERK